MPISILFTGITFEIDAVVKHQNKQMHCISDKISVCSAAMWIYAVHVVQG